MKVAEIQKLRDLRLIAVLPDKPVMEITHQMAVFNIGVVVVVDDQMTILGVISERDIIRCLGTPKIPFEDVTVGDLMTKSVVTISPEDSLVDAVLTMHTKGIRHLVIAKDGKPVDVISIRDVLKAFAQHRSTDDDVTDPLFAEQFVEALTAA